MFNPLSPGSSKCYFRNNVFNNLELANKDHPECLRCALRILFDNRRTMDRVMTLTATRIQAIIRLNIDPGPWRQNQRVIIAKLFCRNLNSFRDSSVDRKRKTSLLHYCDVITSVMASQIAGVTIANWAVCSGTYQRNNQSSALLALRWAIHRWIPCTKSQ